jgi:hypothetical protein
VPFQNNGLIRGSLVFGPCSLLLMLYTRLQDDFV